MFRAAGGGAFMLFFRCLRVLSGLGRYRPFYGTLELLAEPVAELRLLMFLGSLDLGVLKQQTPSP